MTALQAIVLGLVQGVTEFLPVSSSAHLILGSKFFGWPDQGIHFDMAANTGSLIAVMVYLRHTLAELLSGLRDLLLRRQSAERTMALQVLAATVPVGLVGLATQDFVGTSGRTLWFLGLTSLVFGLILAWADTRQPTADSGRGWSWREVTWVGLAQALAVFPGTSRSGVTMTGGLFAGMTREQATRLSFVLAVPVGLLVAAKDGWDLMQGDAGSIDWQPMALGSLVAAVSAYIAIGWLVRWVRRRSFLPFAIYRVLLGILLLTLAAF